MDSVPALPGRQHKYFPKVMYTYKLREIYQNITFTTLCLGRSFLFDSFVIHANNTSDAVTSVHIFECLVDLIKWLPVCDELIDLESALEVIVDKTRKLGTTLHTAKSATLPATSGDELER